MNEEKIKKAEILLDAIGELDDELLFEATEYRKKRRPSLRVIAMAAVFAIIFTLVAGNVLIKQFFGMSGNFGGVANPVPDAPSGGNDMAPPQNGGNETEPPRNGDNGSSPSGPYTLDMAFTSGLDRESFDYVSDPDTLPYIDGNVHIVWRYGNENRYYISEPLENAEFETIKYALGTGRYAGESSPDTEVGIWVLLGDGRVISPYLMGSSGNISIEIFDYEVEIIPHERLVENIVSILLS